jgi:DNA (cytosine-5)-methyltransferase 1
MLSAILTNVDMDSGWQTQRVGAPPTMKILDLFSGIGGFSLGLERAGMQTVAFCEVDPACRQVLKKHWPDVPIFEDVKTLTAKDIHDTVDVICGGFPCQDISVAGRGAGLAGARSGLWYEYRRLIQEIRPRYVIIENVAALRSRGLDAVLRSLAEIGYDAQWHCIPASALGAPHQRDRIWLVAYAERDGCISAEIAGGAEEAVRKEPTGAHDAFDAARTGGLPTTERDVADASSTRLSRGERIRDYIEENIRRWQAASRPASESCPVSGRKTYSWDVEPAVGRVADGVPGRVDRLKQLGNAVVPQIPELIGRAILDYENSLARF